MSAVGSNAMIEATTREAWIRTVKDQVFLRMPILAALMEQRSITWKAGTAIKRTLDIAEVDELAQEYSPQEALTSGRKTFLTTARFDWKYWQLPVVYNIQDEIENGGGEESPVDLIETMTKKAQRGARIKLYKMMFEAASATSDTDKGFQSIPDALGHSRLYGGITSNTTTVAYWNGASLAGTYTDQATQMTATISNIRDMVSRVQLYVEQASDLLCVCGSAIFNSLKSQIEARHIYPQPAGGTRLAKYGFQTFELDGIEFVYEPMFDTNWCGGSTGAGTLPSEWLFMLHLPDWELRFHPTRKLKFTGFKWQGDRDGGFDGYLARIMSVGNLVCWQPNASMFKSYVTPV